MIYKEYKPQPVLQHFIKCYWTLDTECSEDGATQRILPDGCCELVLYRNQNIFERLTTNAQIHRGNAGAIMGQSTRFLQLANKGVISMVGVRFYPYGLNKWLRFPMHEINDISLPVSSAWGTAGSYLQDAVLNAENREEALAHIENFLIKRLRENTSGIDLVAAISAYIIQKKGRVKIKEIAHDSGYSNRYLEKQFREKIGISLKLLSRIIKLQNAVAMLYNNKTSTLTELAYHSDFFDQSHFIHDFKELAGLTPRQYLAEKHLLSDYLIVS